MHESIFNDLLERRLRLCRSTLGKKAAEYSRGDRLHNFKRAGRILDQLPAKACLYFSLKHLVSVMDIVDDLEQEKKPSTELIDEKIGDMINYLILLEALIREERGLLNFTTPMSGHVEEALEKEKEENREQPKLPEDRHCSNCMCVLPPGEVNCQLCRQVNLE